MKKLNRKSASPLPPFKRPAPAPYFHPPFFNFSDSPILGGGGSELCKYACNNWIMLVPHIISTNFDAHVQLLNCLSISTNISRFWRSGMTGTFNPSLNIHFHRHIQNPIKMGVFCENSSRLSAVNYSRKKPHLRWSAGFWIRF